ncbi:MAG: hypothetical protein JXR23_03695 [Pontiellaceae bacterium]|nr:hypothetical protein [Pontiellaceae bacterium]
MKKSIQAFFGAVAFLILSGCLGYQLGGGRPEGIETVALKAVVNKTGETALEQEVTHALRERIQFDGRLKLVDLSDQPDGIIEVHLQHYQLIPIAYHDRRDATPELYRLTLHADAELIRTVDGETVSSSQSYGETQLPFQSDLTSAKRDALPNAAAELAKYMLSDLIDPW